MPCCEIRQLRANRRDFETRSSAMRTCPVAYTGPILLAALYSLVHAFPKDVTLWKTSRKCCRPLIERAQAIAASLPGVPPSDSSALKSDLSVAESRVRAAASKRPD